MIFKIVELNISKRGKISLQLVVKTVKETREIFYHLIFSRDNSFDVSVFHIHKISQRLATCRVG